MSAHLLLRIVQGSAWLIAISWIYKAVEAALGLRRIANLLEERYDCPVAGTPLLTVVVPARNEAADIAECLKSLIAQDYSNLQIITVNDRSTDETGALMDALAKAFPERLRALHITELPEDLLGKTHAMAMAASQSQAEWLLFTDADVLFRPDSVRRSLAYAVASGADHLVTMPTTIIRRWDEGALLGFFQIFGLWAARPWKVADPRARRDAIGVGAFNMIRRGAYEQIGGFEALRMEIVEDLGLGRRVKRAGLAQRIAFGRELVRLHWASGALGLVRVMTKNIFSAFRFYISLTLIACAWLIAFCAAPAFGLLFSQTRLPAILALAAIAVTYWLYGKISGIPAWQSLLSPIAALVFVYALLRSMVTTLRQGGVMWRGTFYPLKTL
ncbi:MAG: glycosyltransferase, partial [Granulicella sp.]